ncbi:hypothetical protein PVAND_015396 [Polypedilum vanderplanki]|uniref:Transmembrane protein n=1 Tax=Polypedilum vanderplanki TaxID=319348 RepID=A0A9J6BCP5_POLVA|nr:hypothetical protein PVAND_015396 [Polypedilum vanderplanki]
MSNITKTSWIISIFNVCCCTIFFFYKYLVFYGYMRISTNGVQDRHKIVSSLPFNPNETHFFTADIDFIFEISAYFLGILFNALLPLGVNTAQEKDAFFFFPGFYVTSIWLTIVTLIQGIRFALLPFIGYSVLNLLFTALVVAIHRMILKEKRRGGKYNGRI